MKLSNRLEQFINDLLYYSRVGRTQEAFQETNLNHIVDEVIEDVKITIKDQSINIRRPNTLPSVVCDSSRIKNIYTNLITNAIKYNDKEEKWVEVGYDENNGENGCTLYVRDNGIGIRDKHLESVFKIFKRLHGRDKYGGGTGAGLTIARKIVENHGGKIWVESTLGQGTTFYFTLARNGAN